MEVLRNNLTPHYGAKVTFVPFGKYLPHKGFCSV